MEKRLQKWNIALHSVTGWKVHKLDYAMLVIYCLKVNQAMASLATPRDKYIQQQNIKKCNRR